MKQTDMQDTNEKKLNLGCGAFRKEGYLNVDGCAHFGPDITHNLDIFPYPFENDAFDLVEADHVLEHLQDPFKVMEELHLKWFAQPYFKKTILPVPVYHGMRILGFFIDCLANLSPFICSRIWCYWLGGFEEIEFRFSCRKA